MNYYNEFDSKAAAWLRELIKQGHIPNGDVDERSITEVLPADLLGYTQCHFFAGIGGWPLALRLAGWPDERPVFTGSCPCQPFSTAGLQLAEQDERHLYPYFGAIIAERRPPVVFGEQVASRLGRAWLSGVFAHLEGVGYAVAGADLCAASVGAPHIRQRLYWCANSQGEHVHAGRHAVAGCLFAQLQDFLAYLMMAAGLIRRLGGANVNPQLCAALMGFPQSWLASAMQSCRPSRRNSSKRS